MTGAMETEATLSATTLAALPCGLWIYDREERLVFANPAAWRMLGVEPALLPPGTPLREVARLFAWRGIFGPGDPESQAAHHLRLDRGRPLRRLLRQGDGTCHEWHGVPLPEGGFCSLLAEVTPYLAAAEEAGQQARRLEAVLAHLHGGLAAFDAEHRLALHNPAYEELLGLPRGTVRPGMPRDEVLRLLVSRGEFAGLDAEELVAERRGLDRSTPLAWQRERPSGQVLRFESQPMPEGGTLLEVTDITAAKRAEDEARRRAALLDGVLESMPHGVVVFGADGRVAMVNAAYQRIMAGSTIAPGEHRDEIARRRALSGEYGPGDPERLARHYVVLRADHQATRQRVRPDGTAIDIRYAMLPDGGQVQVTTDITALHRAEAEAREQATTLRATIDNLRYGITLYGPDRRVRVANALASELAGHPPGTITPGRSLEELVAGMIPQGALPPGPEAELVVRRALEVDRSRSHRYIRRAHGGRVLEVLSDPMPDGGFIVSHIDITPLARAEAEARRRAGIQQAMLDNIRHGIALFDAEDRVVAANPIFRQLLDLPEAVLAPGRPYTDFVDLLLARGEYGEGEAGEAVARTIKGRDRHQTVRSIRNRPDGRVVEVVSDPIPDGGWVLTYTDVTEDRRIRAELEAAKEAAEAANRAKSRFLATMSHELRTPLNAVIGFSEAFMADPDPARGQEFVRSIHEAGRHLLSLIDDILDVTRAETTGLAVSEGAVNLAALAEGSVRVMRATAARAGVRVEASLPPELPRVRADELRLRQVLLNLLSNAVKFTPSGGTVGLTATVEPDGDLVLRVADTGIGMRPEDIPRAFEPFTQLDSSLARRYPGSGLGLYLSRALAEAQGVRLTLESTPGAGTTAVLRIPAARLLAAQPA